MKKTQSGFDAQIAAAPAYARPILLKLRALFHKAYPGIEETAKWGHLTFEHKGLVAGMAAHKEHVRFGFWKAKLIAGAPGTLKPSATATDYGVMKLKSVSDLPPDKVLTALIKRAIELNEKGIKTPRPKPAAPRPELEVPGYFAAALNKAPRAKKAFDAFSYSNRKDYIEWLTEAKQEATRQKRLATALEWLAEGKPRNWKYM
jgi:uncharacterized protein YdeI (YjbR/CyaY-like superfamily)